MTPSYFEYGLIFAAPVALIAAWWLLIIGEKRGRRSWRNRVTLVSLVLLTRAGLLFIPVTIYNSGTHWKSAGELDTHMRHTLTAAAIAIRTCGIALLLSFFGEPRLIALIAIGCIGTWLLWAISIIV